RALTASEIRALYQAGSFGKCKPVLVAAETVLCSAVATFPVGASDNCSTNTTELCLPPSGSTFPLGVTTVTCIASDGCNEVRNHFPVTVRDTQPPVILCPTNRMVECDTPWSFGTPS